MAMAGSWLRRLLALNDAPAAAEEMLLLLLLVLLLAVRAVAFGIMGALEHRFKGDVSTSIVASTLQFRNRHNARESCKTDPIKEYRVRL